jgi:hypothetical protein
MISKGPIRGVGNHEQQARQLHRDVQQIDAVEKAINSSKSCWAWLSITGQFFPVWPLYHNAGYSFASSDAKSPRR